MPELRGGGRVRGGRASGEQGFFRLRDDYQEVIMNAARPFLEEVAGHGADYAKSVVPVRTGRLHDSIQHGTRKVGDSIEAFISCGSNGAYYWQFVEYGTGLAGAGSPVVAGPTSQGYSHGESNGYPARPFMRPALLEMRNEYGR